MPQKDKEDIFLAEHVLEVRHQALGTFLDVRGYIADYIRDNGLSPHWKIDANIVNFRDEPTGIKKEGGFAGYKSAGYVTYNPGTRNYFTDRATLFWKTLIENKHYKIPEIERFGVRTKVFVPSKKAFEDINRNMFENFFTEKARNLIGGKEKDLQFVVELIESSFNVRVTGGPLHKEEAGAHLSFESDHFKKCGLFLDLDFYKTKDVKANDIPDLILEAINLSWVKVEKIASGLGL